MAGLFGLAQGQRPGSLSPTWASAMGGLGGGSGPTSALACSPTKNDSVKTERKGSGSKSSSGWRHTVAGYVGGVSGTVVAYPLDTIKVRLQNTADYRGMWHCASSMVKKEGGLSLYRGLTSPIVGVGAVNALVFWGYGTSASVVRWARGGDQQRELDMWETSLCGVYAGGVSTVVRAPVERVKVVMQTRKNPDGSKVYRSSWACLVGTLKSEGMLSPWKGTGPTLLREFSQYGVYFPLNETFKRIQVPEGGDTDDLTATQLFIAGGMAGTIQWLPPIYSLDVIKTRMQSAPVGTYASAMDCARKSVAAEGKVVFVRGLWPSLVRAFPMHAMVLTMYEVTMRLLNPKEAAE